MWFTTVLLFVAAYLAAQWLFDWGWAVFLITGIGVVALLLGTLVKRLYGEKYARFVPLAIAGVLLVMLAGRVINETLYTRSSWELGRAGARVKLGKLVVPQTPPIQEEAIRAFQYGGEIIEGKLMQDRVADALAKYHTGTITAEEFRKKRQAIFTEFDEANKGRAEFEKRLNPGGRADGGSPPRCSLQPRDDCQVCAGAANLYLERQDTTVKHPVIAGVDCRTGWVELPKGYLEGLRVTVAGKVWYQEPGKPWILTSPTDRHQPGGRVYRFMAGAALGEEPKQSAVTVLIPGKKREVAKSR